MKLIKVTQSALSWLHRHCPQVTQAVLYIVEPGSKCTYSLRCMLTSTGPNQHTNKLLLREESTLSECLFQCVDNSVPIVTNTYGQHHVAYPIRDSTGCAVAVVDMSIPTTESLLPNQLREVTKVLKLLTLAYCQLSHVPELTRPLDQDVSVLFDRLMLSDLKQSVSKLDNRYILCVDGIRMNVY